MREQAWANADERRAQATETSRRRPRWRWLLRVRDRIAAGRRHT